MAEAEMAFANPRRPEQAGMFVTLSDQLVTGR